jgi:hypothetical protein
VVEALKAKRASPRLYPKYWFRQPAKGSMDDWFIQGYFWLCSERLFQHGPIPWSARMLYADSYGLSRDTATVFAIVLTKLDDAFWKFQEDKTEREKKAEGVDVQRSNSSAGL